MASSSDRPPDDPNHLSNDMDTDKNNNSVNTSKGSNAKGKHCMKVRFEFKVINNNTDTYPAPSIHRNILCILEKALPDTTVIVDDNEITSSESTDEEFQSKFDYKILERAKHRTVEVQGCHFHNSGSPFCKKNSPKG